MAQYNSTILHVFGGQGHPLGLTALAHFFKIHQSLTGDIIVSLSLQFCKCIENKAPFLRQYNCVFK